MSEEIGGDKNGRKEKIILNTKAKVERVIDKMWGEITTHPVDLGFVDKEKGVAEIIVGEENGIEMVAMCCNLNIEKLRLVEVSSKEIGEKTKFGDRYPSLYIVPQTMEVYIERLNGKDVKLCELLVE